MQAAIDVHSLSSPTRPARAPFKRIYTFRMLVLFGCGKFLTGIIEPADVSDAWAALHDAQL